MRYIYLSPHLDDASLSAGGWIYDQTQKGNTVEIWTILAGFPATAQLSDYAQYLHQQWRMGSAKDVVTARRKEDINSAKVLGATTHYFDFLDCIYRQDKNGNWLYSMIFTDPLPEEDDLPQQIADEISKRLKSDDKLVCQFGIGQHVDHVLVRRAAELLGKPLLYVADIPYLFKKPEQLHPHTVEMKEDVEMVSETGIHVWQEAILMYDSQMDELFQSRDRMREQIREYCQTVGGIRFWSK